MREDAVGCGVVGVAGMAFDWKLVEWGRKAWLQLQELEIGKVHGDDQDLP